jgi:predicted DNA-binding protein
MESRPAPRVYVPIRLRAESLARVDRIAERCGKTRSEVLRLAFARGMDAAERELLAARDRRMGS